MAPRSLFVVAGLPTLNRKQGLTPRSLGLGGFVFTHGHFGFHKKRAAPVCMILVISLEAHPRPGAIKATQATQATDLMVFPAPEPAGSGRAQTPPLATFPPTGEFPKTERGPISTTGPLSHYVTEPGDSCGQINPFLPTRRRPTVDHSLVGRGAQRQALRARLPDGHKPQCPSTPCPPVDGEVVARITQFAYCSAGRPNAPPVPVNVSRREGPPNADREYGWLVLIVVVW